MTEDAVMHKQEKLIYDKIMKSSNKQFDKNIRIPIAIPVAFGVTDIEEDEI
jgi:hypothetical protein